MFKIFFYNLNDFYNDMMIYDFYMMISRTAFQSWSGFGGFPPYFEADTVDFSKMLLRFFSISSNTFLLLFHPYFL